jgi:hypothetical protein
MKKDSTKSLIIATLGNRYPLTLNQIFKEIRQHKALSYQAVHKIIKELVNEGIVEKLDKQYFLKKDWVKGQTGQFSRFYLNYFNTNYSPNQIDPKSPLQVFRFATVKELGDFLIEALAKGYFEPNDGKIYIAFRRIMPFIPTQLVSLISKLKEKHEIFLVSKGNTWTDRWGAKVYRSLGMKVKLGVDTANFNTVCIGGCVIQFFNFVDDAYRKRLYGMIEKVVPTQTLMKKTSELLYRQTDLYLIINRHPVLVEYIKKSIEKEFY